jgi:hypothetical protein
LHNGIVSKRRHRRNRKAVPNKVPPPIRTALGRFSLKKTAAVPFRCGMGDVNSSKVATEPERPEATEFAGPLSPTLLDALRAYVRYNKAAIEVAFRKAVAKGRRFGP